jgi:riboflavin synthase
MFTGIVERTVQILHVTEGPKSRRLMLANHWPDVKHGDSIAVNGCCLTVADLANQSLAFDVIAESLEKTNLGSLKAGDDVNVERALRVGDRFDGHFVQGHIDGTVPLVSMVASAEEWRLTLEAPEHLAKYLVPKGSIAIDGVSLTLAAVEGNRFDVALIPTTLQLTTLASRKIGWRFNFEADVFCKTIVSYLERMKA